MRSAQTKDFFKKYLPYHAKNFLIIKLEILLSENKTDELIERVEDKEIKNLVIKRKQLCIKYTNLEHKRGGSKV